MRHLPAHILRLRLVYWCVLLAIVALSTFAAPVYAQGVVADPTAAAGQRPNVTAAPNGVPLVNIARPNARGLSHNLFREFSVSTKGVILNNSRQEAARSVMGGIVPGNGNLRNGAASVILNEVTGLSRSQLRGDIEVHGSRADVIIANPNGITCNGCGFINTPRATLTTGVPEIDSTGKLTGFRVETGDITFGPLGANFIDVNAVDILSRKIFINGRIDAKTLRLIAGHNRINYATGQATALSNATSNEIVIDSSLLGGMYAERLSIIANNRGTGVRMRGDMATNVGDLTLSADGSIQLGRASARRKLTLRSARGRVRGKKISARGKISVVVDKSITFDATPGPLDDPTQFHAVSSDSYIELRSLSDGVSVTSLASPKHITISALNDIIAETVTSNQNITMSSAAGNIGVEQTNADGDITLTAESGRVTGRKIRSLASIDILARDGIQFDGTPGVNEDPTTYFAVAANQSIDLETTVGDVSLSSLGALGDVTVSSVGNITADQVLSEQDVRLTSQSGNIDFLQAYAGGQAHIQAANGLSFNQLSALGDLSAVSSAGSIQFALAHSAGNAHIVAANSVSFSEINAVGNAEVKAINGGVTGQTLHAEGHINAQSHGTLAIEALLSEKSVQMHSAAGNVDVGSITSAENITISSQNNLTLEDVQSLQNIELTSTSGSIAVAQALADGSVMLEADSGEVRSGEIWAEGSINISAASDIVIDGTPGANDDPTTYAALISNQSITAQSSGGSIDVTSARALGDLTILGFGDVALDHAQSNSDITVSSTSGALDIVQTSSDGDTLLQASGVISFEHSQAQGTITATSTSGQVTFDEAHAGAEIDVQAADTIEFNQIQSFGNITITATSGEILGATVAAEGAVALSGNNGIDVERIFSKETIDVVSANGGVGITTVSALSDVTISALNNLELDEVSTNQEVNLTSTSGNITVGQTLAGGNIAIDAHQTLSAEEIFTNKSLSAVAGNNITVQGSVSAREDMTLTADSGQIAAGSILTDGTLSVWAHDDITVTDLLSALGDATVASQAGGVSASDVLTDGSLTISVRDDVTVTNDIVGLGQVRLTTSSGKVQAQTIASGDALEIQAKTGVAASKDLIALGAMTVTADSGDVTARSLSSVGEMTLNAQNLIASQDVISDAGIDITTVSSANVAGDVVANAGDVRITAGTGISYNSLSANRDAVLSSGTNTISLDRATSAGRNLEITSTSSTLDWRNKSYSLTAGEQVIVSAENADLSGGSFVFGDVLFSITNDLDLSDASLTSDAASGADITITTKILTHTANSHLVAGGNLFLTLSQSFTNRMVIGAFGDTVMKVSGNLTNVDTGLIGAGNNVGLFVTGTVTNKDGAALWATDGDLVIAGSDAGVTHLAGGGFLLPGNLDSLVKAGKVTNSSAVIEAGRDIVIATRDFENKRSIFSTTAISNSTRYFGSIEMTPRRLDGEDWSFLTSTNFTLGGPIHNIYRYFSASDYFNACSWCEDFIIETVDSAPSLYRHQLTAVSVAMILRSDVSWEKYDINAAIIKPYTGFLASWTRATTPALEQEDWLMIAAPLYSQNKLPIGGMPDINFTSSGQQISAESTPEARVFAGRDLKITSGNTISNTYSRIEANRDITLTGQSLDNVGASFSSSQRLTFKNDVSTVGGYHYQAPNFVVGEKQYAGWRAEDWKNAPIVYEGVRPTKTLSHDAGGASGTIKAGGTISGDFTGQVNNTTIAEGVAPNNAGIGRSFGGQQTLALLAPSGKQTVGSVSGGHQALSALDPTLGQNVDPIAGNTPSPFAASGLPPLNLTVPERHFSSVNSLSTLSGGASLFQPSPEREYLYETRAPFIDVNRFFGSAYFMNVIGYNPDQQVKFLGDAFFETRLIEQTILNATGKRFLDESVTSAADQVKKLIDTGAEKQQALGLSVGVELTAAQIRALNEDIVWYVEREVQGQTVLVPEVFLAPRTTLDLANDGAIIEAKHVNLTSGGDIANRGGRISGGDSLSLTSTEGSITLAAVSNRQELARGNVREWLGRRGTFSSDGTLTLLAADDLNIEASLLSSDGDAAFGAGGNINITSQELTNTALMYGRKGYRAETKRTDQILSDLTIGGDAEIVAQSGSIVIEGGRMVVEGDARLDANEDVRMSAVEERRDTDISHKKGFHREKSTTARENYLAAGGDVTIRSGNNTEVTASQLSAGATEPGDLTIIAGNRATIESGENTHDQSSYSKKSGLLSSRTSIERSHDEQTVGSRVAASGNVAVVAEGDVTVKASGVEAGQDIALLAGRRVDNDGNLVSSGEQANVNITTNREDDSYYKYEKSSGIGGGRSGNGVSVGYRKEKHIIDTKTATHALAYLSAEQNVIVSATQDIDGDAPLIAANESISLSAGRDVNVKSVQDLFDHHETHEVSQFGVTVSVFENVSSAVNAVTEFDTGTGSGVATAIASVSSTLRVIDAIDTLANGHLAGVSASVGFSSTKSTLDQNYATAKGGVLEAGEDVDVTAGRDITLQGTHVAAGGDVTLDAGRDLNLEAATSTASERSSHKSTSASVGVTAGVGLTGVGVSASANASASKSNSQFDSTSYTNTTVAAGGDVSLNSGRDTTLSGAEVGADNRVTARVGRNLHLESLQDTARAKSSSSGVSVGATLGNGGVSGVNASVSKGSGKQDTAWTNAPTAIVGQNGVDIRTEEHTQLDGALIHAPGGQVNLDTGTFGHSDLQDRDKRKNVDVTVAVNSGVPDPSAETNAGFTVSGNYTKKDKEGVTRATAGSGTITIRDAAGQAELEASGQTKDLAALNRDVDKFQQVTKDEEVGFSFYASDTSLTKAVETADIVGKAVGAAVDSLFGALADQGRESFAALKEAKDNGLIDDAALIDQLGACTGGGSQGFNIWQLFIGPAHAAGGCTVTLADGRKIELSEHDKETCLKVYLVAAWNAGGALGDTETAKGFAQGIRDEIAGKGEHFKKVAGYIDTYMRGEGPGYAEAEAFVQELYAETKQFAADFASDPSGVLSGIAREEIANVQLKFYGLIKTAQKSDAYAIGAGSAALAMAIIPANRIAKIAEKATKVGETSSTATGKSVHKDQADQRRRSDEFDLVNEPIRGPDGEKIQVPRRTDLKTGKPISDKGTQSAIPDAVVFNKGGVIIDDKPLGRPIAKDRQEMIRFIKAYEQKTGKLPEKIAIQRYDPSTGKPTFTEIFKPSDFLPKSQ